MYPGVPGKMRNRRPAQGGSPGSANRPSARDQPSRSRMRASMRAVPIGNPDVNTPSSPKAALRVSAARGVNVSLACRTVSRPASPPVPGVTKGAWVSLIKNNGIRPTMESLAFTTPVNWSRPLEPMFSMMNEVSATRVLPAVRVRPPSAGSRASGLPRRVRRSGSGRRYWRRCWSGAGRPAGRCRERRRARRRR